MADPKEAVVQELLDHLSDLQREATETRRTINSLRRRMGQLPMFPDEELVQGSTGGRIRTDQFFGKALATAVREYLELRGQAATPQEILAALQEGGFDLAAQGWRKEDRVRSLSISLSKNTQTFVKLPSGTFGLRSKYPDLPKATVKAENGEEAKE